MSNLPSYHPHPGVKDKLNAFIDFPDVTVENAKSGPLTGLTFGVKDIYDVAGYKTGCGNPDHYAEIPVAQKSAYGVQRLLDAGAKFVGKTQTDEFAWCISGLSTHLPFPVNSIAPDRTPGGSSSGSAAAVVGHLCDIAVASDTQGSVRTPGSYCGLIGLRTTHGRIPMDGCFKACPSMDTFGWFAKDLETYEKVAEVLLGPTKKEVKDENKVKLVTLNEFDEVLMSEEEKEEYHNMRKVLEEVFGAAEIVGFKRPLEELGKFVTHIRSYEQWSLHGSWYSAKPRSITPQVRERYEYAKTVTKATHDEYTKNRNEFREELRTLLGDSKLLVLPSTPSVAPYSDVSPQYMQNYRARAVKALNIASLSGFPQITLPIGKVNGLPFGISLIGQANDDELLLKVARKVLTHVGKQ
jgi:amidase